MRRRLDRCGPFGVRSAREAFPAHRRGSKGGPAASMASRLSKETGGSATHPPTASAPAPDWAHGDRRAAPARSVPCAPAQDTWRCSRAHGSAPTPGRWSRRSRARRRAPVPSPRRTLISITSMNPASVTVRSTWPPLPMSSGMISRKVRMPIESFFCMAGASMVIRWLQRYRKRFGSPPCAPCLRQHGQASASVSRAARYRDRSRSAAA